MQSSRFVLPTAQSVVKIGAARVAGVSRTVTGMNICAVGTANREDCGSELRPLPRSCVWPSVDPWRSCGSGVRVGLPHVTPRGRRTSKAFAEARAGHPFVTRGRPNQSPPNRCTRRSLAVAIWSHISTNFEGASQRCTAFGATRPRGGISTVFAPLPRLHQAGTRRSALRNEADICPSSGQLRPTSPHTIDNSLANLAQIRPTSVQVASK